MQSGNMSLEEVFLKLTGDAKKDRAAEIDSELFEVDENTQEYSEEEVEQEEGE